jgi:hypothetical protein
MVTDIDDSWLRVGLHRRVALRVPKLADATP